MTTNTTRTNLLNYTDQFKQPDGSYLDPEGYWYKDWETFLIEYVFGWCGCGHPWDALEYVFHGLSHIRDLTTPNRPIKAYDFDEASKSFHSNGESYFFWYWADSRDLIDHGGSVPGWLSDKGIAILAELRTYYEELQAHYEKEDHEVLTTERCKTFEEEKAARSVCGHCVSDARHCNLRKPHAYMKAQELKQNGNPPTTTPKF